MAAALSYNSKPGILPIAEALSSENLRENPIVVKIQSPV
jgi:hypothetical protein